LATGAGITFTLWKLPPLSQPIGVRYLDFFAAIGTIKTLQPDDGEKVTPWLTIWESGTLTQKFCLRHLP
jgi:hypothetical protein